MRLLSTTLMMIAMVVATACDLVDPSRPTVQPDEEVFGNLLDAERSPDDASQWIVRIQAGTPRALRAAEVESGRPTPTVEKGLIVTVTVGPDAIVVAGDRGRGHPGCRYVPHVWFLRPPSRGCHPDGFHDLPAVAIAESSVAGNCSG